MSRVVASGLARLVVALSVVASAHGQTVSANRTVSYTYDATTGQVLTEQVDPGTANCVEKRYRYDAYGNKDQVLTRYCGTDAANKGFDPILTVNTFAAQAVNGSVPAVPAGAYLTQTQVGKANPSTLNSLAEEKARTATSYDPRHGLATSQRTVAVMDNGSGTVTLNTGNDLPTTQTLNGLGRVTSSLSVSGKDASGNPLGSVASDVGLVYCAGPLASPSGSAELAACLSFVRSVSVTYDSGMLFDSAGNSVSTATITAKSAYYVVTRPRDGAGNALGARTRVHYDSLHREIAKETENYDLSWTMAITGYDSAGNVAATWSGFQGRNAAGAFTQPNDIDNYMQRTSRRDLLHRPVEQVSQVVLAEGGAPQAVVGTVTYEGLVSRATVPDPYGGVRETRSVKYATGQVALITDAANGRLIKAYDAVGNLVKTVTTSAPDAYGARSQIETNIAYTPTTGRFKEGMSDVNQGTWSYAYNALGQLVKQTDGRGKVTTLAYDVLGRMVSKTSADQNSQWYYDKDKSGAFCAGGLNRLCETYAGNPATNAQVTGKKVTYDRMGRALTQTVNLAGRNFVSSAEYDALGRQSKLTYPTGFAVGYGYSGPSSGVLSGVLQKVFDASLSSRVFWRIDTVSAGQVFDAKGNLLRADYGRNDGASGGWVTANNGFEALGGKVVSRKVLNASSQVVSAQRYEYDLASNMRARYDDAIGMTDKFDFDKLDRLTGHTATSSVNASYNHSAAVNYDALGNIGWKTDAGGYSYVNAAGQLTHAVQKLYNANGSTTTFSYDGNGNLLATANSAGAGSNRTNTWTSFNTPNTLQQGSSSVGFKYDADYQRVEEIIASGTTVRTLHKLHPDNQGGLGFEREVVTVNGARTVNENRHYLSVGGQVIGVVKTNTPLANDLFIGAMNGTLSTAAADANLVNYWHKDSLGSIITVTNRDGAVIERMAFDAWGARETSNGAAAANVNPAHGDRGYTGHEHLDEIGLVHMNGRIYDPVLARFMSPDPVVGDPSDMQHYNRYAYVANSPLRYTDPSGHCVWDYCVLEIAAFIVGYEMTQKGNENWRMVGSIMMMWAGQGLVEAGLGNVSEMWANGFATNSSTFNVGGIGNSFVASAGATLASGGSVEQAITAGVFASAFTAAGAEFKGQDAKLIASHMVLGCAQAAAAGGACGPSAIAAGFGKAATIGLDASDFGVLGNGVTTAVVGGTASAIGGGKFSNGAKQAAFGYLFNYCATSQSCWEDAQRQVMKVWIDTYAVAAKATSTIFSVLLMAPAAPEIAAATAGEMFFTGATYQARVLSQAKLADNHAFPAAVDTFAAKFGQVGWSTDKRGVAVEMLTIRGEYNGASGTFEYIKNRSNQIYHRFFNPDKP